MKRIAIVDDDVVILQNYTEFLRSRSFIVDAYASKDSALIQLMKSPPELALLDISLNGDHSAGFAVCMELRRHFDLLPIIFLTSHDSEIDKIHGMRLEADDYITKDVSLDYLATRIETLLRRRDAYRNQSMRRETIAGPIDVPLIDENLSMVTWRSHRVVLPLTEFWIFQELFTRPGQVRSHDDLMRAGRIVVERNTVTAHVKSIRDAFKKIDPLFNCIVSERGRGYRWIPR